MAIDNFAIGAAMTHLGPLARQNLFLFEINSIPGGGLPEDIMFAVEKASIPKSKTDPMKIPWMNSEYKIPSTTTYEDISVGLRVSEQNGMHIYDTIYNWYKMIYDPATGIQMPPALTMSQGAKISLLNYQGSVVKTWDIMNIFPTECGGTDLSRDSAEKQVMTINFAYTYATMNSGSLAGTVGALSQLYSGLRSDATNAVAGALGIG
jgi:phage tail-like protein